jgi:hypothetical protein
MCRRVSQDEQKEEDKGRKKKKKTGRETQAVPPVIAPSDGVRVIAILATPVTEAEMAAMDVSLRERREA